MSKTNKIIEDLTEQGKKELDALNAREEKRKEKENKRHQKALEEFEKAEKREARRKHKELEEFEKAERREAREAKKVAEVTELSFDSLDEVTIKYVHNLGYMFYDERFSGDDEWKNALVCKRKKLQLSDGYVYIKDGFEKIIENYLAYYSNSPRYGERLWWNDWTRSVCLDDSKLNELRSRELYVNIELDTRLKDRPSINDTYYIVAHDNHRNPVHEWFKSLIWDGQPRVETMLIDCLGAADTDYTRYVTKTWMIGAVKRVFQPGCKNEQMLVLCGAQGAGKTTLWNTLFGKWGIESNIDIKREPVQTWGMKLDNAWLVMLDEMPNFDKTDSNIYKNWLSGQVDNFRSPYDRQNIDHYRHCCYVANTNSKYFLKDYTDSLERRYWPVECTFTREQGWKIISQYNEDWVEQIWAEVYYYYTQNPDIAIALPYEMDTTLETLQKEFKVSNEDNVHEILEEILNREYILQNDGQFLNVQDMLSQIKNGVLDRLPVPHQEYIGKINKIRSSYVKEILKNVIRDPRKHEYFAYNLAGRWSVNKQDAELHTKCYVRLTEEDGQIKMDV